MPWSPATLVSRRLLKSSFRVKQAASLSKRVVAMAFLMYVSEQRRAVLTPQQFSDLNTVLLLVLLSASPEVPEEVLDERSREVISYFKRGIRFGIGAVCGKLLSLVPTADARYLAEESVSFVLSDYATSSTSSALRIWHSPCSGTVRSSGHSHSNCLTGPLDAQASSHVQPATF